MRSLRYQAWRNAVRDISWLPAIALPMFAFLAQVMGRAVVPGAALLEAAAAAARLLLPAEHAEHAALAAVAIVAPLMLDSQVGQILILSHTRLGPDPRGAGYCTVACCWMRRQVVRFIRSSCQCCGGRHAIAHGTALLQCRLARRG
jgi:Polyketide synthase dehydratase